MPYLSLSDQCFVKRISLHYPWHRSCLRCRDSSLFLPSIIFPAIFLCPRYWRLHRNAEEDDGPEEARERQRDQSNDPAVSDHHKTQQRKRADQQRTQQRTRCNRIPMYRGLTNTSMISIPIFLPMPSKECQQGTTRARGCQCQQEQ